MDGERERERKRKRGSGDASGAGSSSGSRSSPQFDEYSIKELKEWLRRKGVTDFTRFIEKQDLVKEAKKVHAVECRPKAFEIMHVGGVHPKGKRLQDLCRGEVKAALVSNYLLDADFLIENFPDVVRAPELIVAYDERNAQSKCIKERLVKERGWMDQDRSRLVLHAPPLPIPYGTHHSKFFILFFRDKMRLIITTANLIEKDCCYKTQGIWFQDFFLKKERSSCSFEIEFIQYLNHLNLPRTCMKFLENVKKVDFSPAKALCLIASVPGYHKANTINLYGHMKLRRVLSQETFKYCFSGSPLICQYSSVGSLDRKWVQEEFVTSLSAGRLSGSGHLGPPANLERDLHLVWPTYREVATSLEGLSAGTSIPGAQKNVCKDFLLPHYRKWGSVRAAPHIKTYMRYSGSELAWVVVGSHNLSKAAWGCLQKQGSQLCIRHYELSVAVKVADDMDVPLPFQFPPEAYTNEDTPWSNELALGRIHGID
ncbi:tyrosyl-DNA phosphodiesterase [Chloropicon primus]|uniref:Tyrosyl-DNA phosphodiesterase n=1 Tax=Chloropicon primus TaxID=1764295 RepID=A0A5B8MY06_9CHLO|nr:tyrosyl-DNA phosphodiesterase [Chloropicon primus]UPR04659.1 tyrosyl-DNA phosphodiesterase [Chloropicon primus]|mmetsp:Transcript_1164/g.3420  ORF Transcript_1164/g.3420 Transcript_1164/m.3420 type:complete len:484 (-) Transcript_1164:51-1502(-)|eukprot:QDZ25463.1 tyrosyl-DNA phosphodiesterase [Chloropicon primus]